MSRYRQNKTAAVVMVLCNLCVKRANVRKVSCSCHNLAHRAITEWGFQHLTLMGVSDLQNGSRWQLFQDALNPDQENLDLANVNLMLELLVQKKKQLEAVS